MLAKINRASLRAGLLAMERGLYLVRSAQELNRASLRAGLLAMERGLDLVRSAQELNRASLLAGLLAMERGLDLVRSAPEMIRVDQCSEARARPGPAGRLADAPPSHMACDAIMCACVVTCKSACEVSASLPRASCRRVPGARSGCARLICKVRAAMRVNNIGVAMIIGCRVLGQRVRGTGGSLHMHDL